MVAIKSALVGAVVGAGGAVVLFELVWIGGAVFVGEYYGSTVGRMWLIIAEYGARAAAFGAVVGGCAVLIQFLWRERLPSE